LSLDVRFRYLTVPSDTIVRGSVNSGTVASIHDELGEVLITVEAFSSFDEMEEWVQCIEGLNFGLINAARQSDVRVSFFSF
jgi:hypothetical protein